MFHDPEAAILRGAARLKAGDQSGVDEIVPALKELKAEDWRLARSVAQVIMLPNEDVQIFGVLALAKMGDRVTAHVPAIAEVMRNARAAYGGPAAAAVYALGEIGTREAFEAIKQWMSACPSSDVVAVSPLLGPLGLKGEPLLPMLTERAQDPSLDDFSRAAVNRAADEIRLALRLLHGNTMGQIRSVEELVYLDPVPGDGGMPHPSASYREPLDSAASGLLVDNRFKFFLNGQQGEQGLKIYGDGTGRHLVVMCFDGESFGVSPTNGAEVFASAITRIYGLNPDLTTWVEHYAESCGAGHPRTAEISFQRQEGGILFAHPDWTPRPSLDATIRAWGVEPVSGT
jgi:hypothetical protein